MIVFVSVMIKFMLVLVKEMKKNNQVNGLDPVKLNPLLNNKELLL